VPYSEYTTENIGIIHEFAYIVGMKEAINIRIEKEAHRIAKINAAMEGLSLIDYLTKVIKEADKRKK